MAEALKQLEPFHEDVLQDGYRHCDFCYESAADDIMDGKLSEKDWRQFFQIPDDGLCICSNCVSQSPESLTSGSAE